MAKFVKHPFYSQWFNVDHIQEINIKGDSVNLTMLDYENVVCVRFNNREDAEDFIVKIVTSGIVIKGGCIDDKN